MMEWLEYKIFFITGLKLKIHDYRLELLGVFLIARLISVLPDVGPPDGRVETENS
jgi:hypothetical protein